MGNSYFQSLIFSSGVGGVILLWYLTQLFAVNGTSLTITLRPTNGDHASIAAIETFQIIVPKSKTLPDEFEALQAFKTALRIPASVGWNSDPCIPHQHPWSGIACHFDKNTSKWVIHALNLSKSIIHGAIPSSLGGIPTLQVLDLSYNSFNGSIPETLGQLTSLEELFLNSNMLTGRVPAALGGMLARFNFSVNPGLGGIPGTHRMHLTSGIRIAIGFGVAGAVSLILACFLFTCKRRQRHMRLAQPMAVLKVTTIQTNEGSKHAGSQKIQ